MNDLTHKHYIGLANNSRNEAMGLWQTVFGDTDEFVRFYFDRKYSDANTVVAYAHDRLISMLQMLPYPMTWEGQVTEVSYVSGAATLPEARGKGLMGSLLKESFLIMRERKLLFSVLIPQEQGLYDYYAGYGYAAVFFRAEDCPVVSFPITGTSSVFRLSLHEYREMSENLYAYFHAELLKRPDCVQHPEDDFYAIIEDLYGEGGEIRIFCDSKNRLKGLLLALPEESCVVIKELLTDSELEKEALIASFFPRGQKILYRRPAHAGDQLIASGMLRIICLPEVLKQYARMHPALTQEFNVTDNILEDNNGYYRISGGNCTRLAVNADLPVTDISELPTRLFSRPAYMSLMLE